MYDKRCRGLRAKYEGLPPHSFLDPNRRFHPREAPPPSRDFISSPVEKVRRFSCNILWPFAASKDFTIATITSFARFASRYSTTIHTATRTGSKMSRFAPNNIMRGSLGTMPGPGGAGSIGHYLQPCRKVVLNYCETSPASQGVRTWLAKSGAHNLATMWPQIEWVVQQGKRGSEPGVTAHYGE